ncbi:MAG: hypothetical protein ABI718_15655 [Acidobacteriota bacterium]
MRRTVTIAAALVLSLTLTGCKAKEIYDSARASADLQKRGTTDVLKQASKDQYKPPADGRLTDTQVQMYLKVREHEKQIAAIARKQVQDQAKKIEAEGDKSLSGMVDSFKTLGSVADLATADIRAAQDLHYNTAEYMWVKGKILEASAASLASKMGDTSKAILDSSRSQLQKQYDDAKDEQSKKLIGDMLAAYDEKRKEAGSETEKLQQDPSIAYNQQLLSKYDSDLNVYATELSKWTGNEEETKKAVQDWQKGMDEAVKKAQTQTQTH